MNISQAILILPEAGKPLVDRGMSLRMLRKRVATHLWFYNYGRKGTLTTYDSQRLTEWLEGTK